MNTRNLTYRRFPRTLHEAFPNGADYGCSITHYRRRARSFAVGAGVVVVLFVVGMLMGASAHAQTITHIAEYGTHRITLGDEPCPANRALSVAVWSTPNISARACYWVSSDGLVRFDWYQRRDGLSLPASLPMEQFKGARP